MRMELCSSRLTLAVCLAAGNVMFLSSQAEAGSLVIPAWSFARGNAQVHANPDEYADAGPVVGSGTEKPWGWSVEYDIDVPIEAEYTLHICYASAEARPVQVFVDNRNQTKCCDGVTLAGGEGVITRKSSGAKWEGVRNLWGRLITLKLTKGVHTIKLARRGPLPHLVALRLDTETPFPENWKPVPTNNPVLLCCQALASFATQLAPG